jgi:hypothetical protein
MKDFETYLQEKMNNKTSINDKIDARKEQLIKEKIEYNWFVDSKLAQLEGDKNERV